jgi:hypothetical protein
MHYQRSPASVDAATEEKSRRVVPIKAGLGGSGHSPTHDATVYSFPEVAESLARCLLANGGDEQLLAGRQADQPRRVIAHHHPHGTVVERCETVGEVERCREPFRMGPIGSKQRAIGINGVASLRS